LEALIGHHNDNTPCTRALYAQIAFEQHNNCTLSARWSSETLLALRVRTLHSCETSCV